MQATPAITEPVIFIHLSLAQQPRHGYSILKDVEKMSDGRVRLSTGTLYGRVLRQEVARMQQLTRLATLRFARREA